MKTAKLLTIFFVLIALMLTAKAALGAVYINEILANPTGADNGNTEWIELYSDSNEDVDLTGWYIEDSSKVGNSLSGTLTSNEPYKVFSTSELGLTSLSNSGEMIDLYNSNDELQDSIDYQSVAEGHSYARAPDGVDNWQELDVPNPNSQNTPPPALDIDDSSVTIYINGDVYSLEDKLDVSANDMINVEFDYQNNLDAVMGYVLVTAESDIDPDFVNYENEDWALLPGYFPTSDSFEFTIPASASGDFKVTILVSNEDNGNVYQDNVEISFNLMTGTKAVMFERVELEDSTLTCNKITNLQLGITNTGASPYQPDIRIFNQEAEIVSGVDELELTFEVEPTFTLEYAWALGNEIFPGMGAYIDLAIDMSELEGPQTLYVYLVSPSFYDSSADTFYFGESAIIEIEEVGECLNIEAIEEELKTVKNSLETKEVYLFDIDSEGEYLYIYEDTDYEASLIFEIFEQDNIDVVECDMDQDLTTIICESPISGNAGNSDLVIEITEQTSESVVSEDFTVEVINTISISDVKVNGISLSEGSDGPELLPLEEVEIQLTATNHLDSWVTGVQAELSSILQDIEDSVSINLNAGESKSLIIKGVVPASTSSGDYLSTITLSGEDYANNNLVHEDEFIFDLVVEQEVSDLFISELTLNEESLTCQPTTSLVVELINAGSNDEDDVIITAKVNGEEYSTEEDELITVLKNGGEYTQTFSIMAEDLSQGNNQVLIEVSYRNDLNKDSKYISISKGQCILSWLPEQAEDEAFVGSTATDEISMEISEEQYANAVVWYVNEEECTINSCNYGTVYGTEFDFSANGEGEFEVYGSLGGEVTQTWYYYVPDNYPLSWSEEYEISYEENPNKEHAKDFTIENQYGEILFTEDVNVEEIFNVDPIVIISDNLFGIDTADNAAPELKNKQATITVKKAFINYLILKAEGFGDNVGDFVPCETTENGDGSCQFVSNSNGNFVFNVTGFSTYKVVEQLPADILITGVEISDVNRGESKTQEITFTNTGSYQDLTNVNVTLNNLDADYNTILTGNVPTTLTSGEFFKLTLTMDIPEDADGGDNVVGKISFVSTEMNKTENIVVSPMSYLSIESIKINGKSSGDFSIEETNEIEVNIENKYTEDMENVQVTVEILDVDGDDLEEESDEQDINEGKDEDFIVEFDLDSSEMDEDSYTIRITVVGEADDNTEHETVETKVVDLDREKHKIVIDKTSLSSSTLQCLRQTTLQVTVENIGEKSEDDIEIWVKNEELGLSLSRTDIELEDYSDSDNDYRATFTINLEDAKEGSYPIEAEVYMDGSLEETEEITIEVRDCYTSSTTSQSTSTYVDEKALAMQLQQQLAAKKNLEVQRVSSFRDTNTYTSLLITLVVLMLIVVVLALAVSAKKPKRRR